MDATRGRASPGSCRHAGKPALSRSAVPRRRPRLPHPPSRQAPRCPPEALAVRRGRGPFTAPPAWAPASAFPPSRLVVRPRPSPSGVVGALSLLRQSTAGPNARRIRHSPKLLAVLAGGSLNIVGVCRFLTHSPGQIDPFVPCFRIEFVFSMLPFLCQDRPHGETITQGHHVCRDQARKSTETPPARLCNGIMALACKLLFQCE